MRYSVVMTTYNRHDFLYYTLCSLRSQLIGTDHELVIVNDGLKDETENVARSSDAVEGINVKYIYSGGRPDNCWRNMGFAANIGIIQASGNVVILTNSDIYHLGKNTVMPVVEAVENDPKAMGTINRVFEDQGGLINALRDGPDAVPSAIQHLMNSPGPPGVYPVNPDVPFFMGFNRELLLSIGGYDEDFVGPASEDNDLLERLEMLGGHFVHGPQGANVVHLYHGRKTIAELHATPGFHYNIRLRAEKKGLIKRNQNRVWGRLPQTNLQVRFRPIHLVMYVTSNCNMSCPMCNQATSRGITPDYDMSMEEVRNLIRVSKQYGITYKCIELTGGEPSIWPHFRQALKELKDSGIAEELSFITNGSFPNRVVEIANELCPCYRVSKTQATPEQIEVHKRLGVHPVFVGHHHVPSPISPIESSIPCDCHVHSDQWGYLVNQLLMCNNRIYRCCPANQHYSIFSDPDRWSVPLDSDWIEWARSKEVSCEICSVCLCNNHVFKTMCAAS